MMIKGVLLGLSVIAASLLSFSANSGPAPAFKATGLVESFTQQGERCEAQIAVFEATELLGSFATGEADIAPPQRDDRYVLRASGDTCQAVNIATIMGGKHIAFSAERGGRGWHFARAPLAGTTCGGIQMQWTPGPITTLY